MDTYTTSAELASKELTKAFSTSFSSASSLFPKSIRQDIYNIYGLVRIADEVVDTYNSDDAGAMLDELEQDVYKTIKTGFSTNIIVHAFCQTARVYSINKATIEPFFSSMRVDLKQKNFSNSEYQRYIYGSAEAVGLMCLKIFVSGDDALYKKLSPGARALGSAFQKVNFLRDIKEDYEKLGRYYFPNGNYESFNKDKKSAIEADINKDFLTAYSYIRRLPPSAQSATKLSFDYYKQLLRQISSCSAEQLKEGRVTVPRYIKLTLLIRAKVLSYVR